MTQRDLLGRVLEKGYSIDQRLADGCAHYPIFRFVKFEDKETGKTVVGHQFVCKSCSREVPNVKCSKHTTLLW
jgi:hypothetical protein